MGRELSPHFRPEINRGVLKVCYLDAVSRGLLRDDLECKHQFLANAYDLAADREYRKPAVLLRSRVARRSLTRHSLEGHQWAKSQTRSAEYVSPGAADIRV